MVSIAAKRQARHRLDIRFKDLGHAQQLARPQGGWVRAIREALGMSAADLGARLDVSAQSVFALESSEANDRARLGTLQRAAAAMNCTLVYAFLPKSSLQETVEAQADRKAVELLAGVKHSMALEDQSTSDDPEQRRALMEELIDSSQLWSQALR